MNEYAKIANDLKQHPIVKARSGPDYHLIAIAPHVLSHIIDGLSLLARQGVQPEEVGAKRLAV